MILALDSATRHLGLAVLSNDTILAEQYWPAGRRQTEQLAPAIARLMDDLDLTPADIQAIAIAIGPGSFSGLRTSLAWAKGFALAQQCALIGVPTLDILAHAQPAFDGQLVCLIQAGRGRIAARTYHLHDGHWRSGSEGRIITWAELAQQLTTATLPTCICGDITPEGRTALQPLARHIQIASPAQNVRRPAILAQIAAAQQIAGKIDDPLTLTPDYWHQPHVTPPKTHSNKPAP